jgi:tetratricopeptide (TPR) repeat protein
MGSTRGTPWRVLISHTAELRDYPKGNSYINAVERAISATGHVIVDMADFPAADQPAAQECVERVRECDVYVGVLGTRYGSPVRDRPEVSYTELEFDTATAAGMPRLVFVLNTATTNVGIPLDQILDLKYGARQEAFRARVSDSGLTRQRFDSPAKLGQLVHQSLMELEKTLRRIDSGMGREQVPAEPRPVVTSRFVNPPPAVEPTWFQNRDDETSRLATYVCDPAIRLVIVSGRGGIGKTAMVCRLLKGLEAGRIPDVEGHRAETTVGGIVYLGDEGAHKVAYLTLVADLIKLLPADTARRLDGMYQDPRHTPAGMMTALLDAFPVGDPVVVLLDNLESVMDADHETLTEQALQEALTAVLTAPAHAVTVITTTRVIPAALLKVEPAKQRRLPLDEGLSSPDAEEVLKALDDDGRLGLRDADDDLLDTLRQHTRGFPRALEAVKAILDADDTLTPQDLVDRTRHLPEDQVVEALIGDAYDLLHADAQQVMQALAVFPTPVSAVGVDFLLQPVNPTTDAAPILARLVRRQMVRFLDKRYHLHPVDRDYALGQIPAGTPGDTPATFTLAGLRARAADYYTTIRTERESWRTLDDIQPQLAEFDLRCDAGDYDTAATVLADIGYDYLRVWGHYRTLVAMHDRLHGRINDSELNAEHLSNLGVCHHSLGDYQQAIDLYTQALTIARDTGHRRTEGLTLGYLGTCHYMLGDYQQALDLHTQALAISREIGDRQGESTVLGNLGLCYYSLGDYQQPIDLYAQALTVAREIGDRAGEARHLGNLGLCHYMLGDYQRAIELHTESLAISREIGFRRGEGADLENLGNEQYMLGDYQRAIDLHTQALTIAREIGSRYLEATALDYLGRAWAASGDVHRARTLLKQATAAADSSGDIEPAVEARRALARVQLLLGEPEASLATAVAALERSYPTEQATLRLLKAVALLGLDRVDEAAQAFHDALDAADRLLALADHNVAALQARAVALSGLATVTGDRAKVARAADAFTQLDAVTTAVGVAEDSRRLLDMIGDADTAGLLADIQNAPEE